MELKITIISTVLNSLKVTNSILTKWPFIRFIIKYNFAFSI